MRWRAVAALAWAATAGCALAAETYTFDAAQYEKKPFELGGYVEFKTEHFGLNRGSAFYGLNFPGPEQRATLDRTGAILKLDAKARAGDWLAVARTHSEARRDQLGSEQEHRFDELYASWKPDAGFSIEAGKRVLKWGKGYAWNPVGFVERPKDPNDPDLAREGFTVLAADFVRSLQGPLQAIAFTPLLLPVSADVNHDFGRPDHVNLAAKLYLLYRDTDIDLYVLGGGSRARRYGADFSRNLSSNLEIHGEWARISAQEFQLTDASGALRRRTEAATSWLLGLRYLTAQDTTYIAELYRNGAGYAAAEYSAFTELARRASAAGMPSGLLQRARMLAPAYARQNPLREYLYLRASQKEPFDLLYLSASLTAIVSLEDRSYSIAPELLYGGRGNLELRARAVFLHGGRGTDFGEKQNERRVELQARIYF